MKTTLEIPDSLFRQAKVKAATDGRKMKDMVAEGLTLVLAESGPAVARRVSATEAVRAAHDAEWAPPSWYGALAAYARRNRVGSDMKTIRASIARGIVAERHL